MKKILTTAALVAGLLSIFSCGAGIRGLYISGYTMSLDPASSTVGLPQIYYWKDGVKEALSSDKYGVAVAIFVSGLDVYVSGFYLDSTSGNSIACYWKNGELVTLDSGKASADTSAIYVDGADIYVAGFHTDSATGKFVASYWKNGIMHSLEPGTDDSFASAITVSGSDVYIAGTGEGGGGQAVYWKNGTKVVIAAVSAMAYGIQVVGTDVYTVGTVDDGTSTGTEAVYWKNTTVNKLTGATEAIATSIQVVGTDVYVVGLYSDFEKIAYWKNGVKTDLTLDTGYIPAGPEASFFNGLPIILVNGTDVYIICLLARGTTFVSGYWLNGTFSKSADTEVYSGLFWR